ncbi:class I SAM-dependent DNA methyltransferase [Natronomonas sp.]|uniref:class I SAM-dependent DNA methyltransferase n=1 Tax=Natronomonas sp. TaxID=2184060 RepID=UPI002FC35E0D
MPSEDRSAADVYDEIAAAYIEDVEGHPYNAHLEFPATTELIPEVAGKRVLDAGCGAGLYTEWLLSEGAEVVGVDASKAMLAEARTRVEGDVEFHEADLAEPLPFADNNFDGIVSGLVLDYIEDWKPLFGEFARVLNPGGFVVLSVKHPFDEFFDGDGENYFAVEGRTKDWDVRDVNIPSYRRPLSAMLNPIIDAGLTIDRVVEPQPTEAFAEACPERYETESKQPVFLAVRATR